MKSAGTLDQCLRRSVGRFGERTAVISGPLSLSYTDLDRSVEQTSAWLRAQGVHPGDRVLLQLSKGVPFLLLHLANMRVGSVSVPVNPLATPRERAEAEADCRPTLSVDEPSLRRSGPRGIVGFAAAIEREGEGADVGAQRQQPSPGPVPGPSPSSDDLACLLYTSGTTGRPKGARLLQRQLAANIETLRQAWGWSEHDRIYHALPLFHVHGLFVAASVALASGATLELAPRFDPERTWSALLSGRTTLFMGVPTMYHRLLAHAPSLDPIALRDPAALQVRLFTSGSAPLREDTLADFEALTGHRILERYGMTEVGMAASNPLHGPRRPGRVGPALPGVGLRIRDRDTGEVLPPDSVGEVEITGPSVFDGYWERPEQTAQCFTEDGWLRSGDLGSLDESRSLKLVGRAKELIISGGLNVYPQEVERVLNEHPEVSECAVWGVPDADFGEAVVAGVVLKEGVDPGTGRATDATSLKRWARERLAAYKLPKRIVFLTELPRNAMGKVQKARLAEMPALRDDGP